MCVRIFGFRDPIALERADELGVALQLINILRDVREDAVGGRIYLPADELARFGISETALLDGRVAPGWHAFMAHAGRAGARRASPSGYEVTAYIPRRRRSAFGPWPASTSESSMDRGEPELPLRARAALSKAAKLARDGGRGWRRMRAA